MYFSISDQTLYAVAKDYTKIKWASTFLLNVCSFPQFDELNLLSLDANSEHHYRTVFPKSNGYHDPSNFRFIYMFRCLDT